MQTKLTLRLEKRLIDRAKKIARREGKSLSQMVADYFRALDGRGKEHEQELGPITRSLKGILRGMEIDQEDYYRYLEEKYR